MPERHVAMIWAQRLKRVFKIDIETCAHYGGAVKAIDCIEDPLVIKQILDHIAKHKPSDQTLPPHAARAPPDNRYPGSR